MLNAVTTAGNPQSNVWNFFKLSPFIKALASIGFI